MHLLSETHLLKQREIVTQGYNNKHILRDIKDITPRNRVIYYNYKYNYEV